MILPVLTPLTLTTQYRPERVVVLLDGHGKPDEVAFTVPRFSESAHCLTPGSSAYSHLAIGPWGPLIVVVHGNDGSLSVHSKPLSSETVPLAETPALELVSLIVMEPLQFKVTDVAGAPE